MPRVLVLAKSNREAGNYAALAGIPVRDFRAVNRASSIHGIRTGEVHVLPSFLERFDRHAILGELRWAKVEVFYVDPADLQPSEPTNGSVGPTDDELEEAYDANAELDAFIAAEAAKITTPEQLDQFLEDAGLAMVDEGAPVAVEAPPKTRRKKCPTCDELFSKDEYGAHLVTHTDSPSSYFD